MLLARRHRRLNSSRNFFNTIWNHIQLKEDRNPFNQPILQACLNVFPSNPQLKVGNGPAYRATGIQEILALVRFHESLQNRAELCAMPQRKA